MNFVNNLPVSADCDSMMLDAELSIQVKQSVTEVSFIGKLNYDSWGNYARC